MRATRSAGGASAWGCALAVALVALLWGAAAAHASVASPPRVAFSWNPGTARISAPIHFASAASDPAGTAITSYAWYFDGDTVIDSTEADPTYAGFSSAGDRLVRLVVTDAQGESTTQEHIVHVHAGNLAPRVDDVSALPALHRAGIPVTLGCDCSDPDGDPGTSLTYDWDFGDGTTHGTGAAPTHTYATAVDRVVRVTATDPQGDSSSNTLALHVHAGNDPPMLRMGPPRTATAAETLPFGVYASDDATAETAMTYSWDFGDNTPAVTAANPDHSFAQPGDYVVRVTVTDGEGGSSLATQVVHVSRPAGAPAAFFSTMFDPTGSVIFVDTAAHPRTGQPVAFSNGSIDPDGLPLASYLWNFGDGQTSTAASPTHTYQSAGDKLVLLTATDAQGLTSKYSEVLQVHVANIAPVASFISSVDSPRTGRSVDFFSEASDADSPASAGLVYDWDFGDGSPHSAQTDPSHTYTASGPHDVRLTVTDSAGATVVAARTLVAHSANLPPEVDPAADTVYPGTSQSVRFTDGSGDRDGQIVSYSWDFGDGSTASDSAVEHAYPTAGDYRVRETVTDDSGDSTSEVLTVHVLVIPPSIASPPVLGGTTQQRQVLTTGPGGWNGSAPITYAYQWVRCDPAGSACADIAGGSGTGAGSAYTLQRADVGNVVTVRVTASNAAGTASASSSPSSVITPAPPLSTSPPTITGGTRDGDVLTAGPGGWDTYSTPTYSYQWRRCDAGVCSDIAGATTPSYRATYPDETRTLRVRVTARNLEGSVPADSAVTSTIAPGPPVKLGDPSITATPRDGAATGSDDGTFGGSPATSTLRTWQLCDSAGASCVDIAGATGATYVPASSDVGRRLRLVVRKLNALGTASGTSAASAVVLAAPPHFTDAPTLTGVTTDGQTLVGGNGSATGTPSFAYTYKWLRCDTAGSACADASTVSASATYALVPEDVGHRMRVRVTASNSVGSDSADSAPSSVVMPIPPELVTPPALTGTARDASVLTAGPGAFTGSAPVRSYRWQRCDAVLAVGAVATGCGDIPGATQATYRASGSDVGHRVLVIVTATNTAGSASGTSQPSEPIAAAPPTVSSPPAPAGSAFTGRSLSGGPGSLSGTAPVVVSYQWTRCDASGGACVAVPGATSAVYTLGAADVGRTLRAQVSAVNAAGSAQAVSPPSAVVLLTIDAGKLRSSLSAALAPAGRAATVPAVLRARGATTSWSNSFGAGSAQLSWSGKSGRRVVLVAKASRTVSASGRASLRFGLTAAGRALLKKSPRGIKLSGWASFTPARQAAVSVSRTVSLRAR